MNIRFLLLSISITIALTSFGQSHNPDAQGYLDRAKAMIRDKNYTGASQQIRQLRTLHPDDKTAEEAHLIAAVAALHLPGQPQALELIESWLQKYPQSVRFQEVTALLGDYYFFNSDYSKAIEIYSSINPSTLNPTTAGDVAYRTAYSKMMLGDSGAAEELFKGLRNNSDWRVPANFYLGYLAYSDGDYKSAKQYFSAVSTNSELSDAANYYMAQIYFAEGDYRQAYDLASQLVKNNSIDEYYAEACRIAGESLFNLNKETEALPYMRKYMAVTSNPAPSACYILGTAEYKEGNYQAAVKYLSRVSSEDNDMGQSANLLLGQSYVSLGKTDPALICFEKAYKMRYDRQVAETALYNYAVAKTEGGRMPFANSVMLFDDFLRQYPDSKYASSVREYMISGYMSDNDYTQALRVIETVKNPSADIIKAKQQCLFLLGTREYNSGEVTSALGRFRQAALLAKGDSEMSRQSILWAGTCQYDLGQYNEAANNFLEYIRTASSKDQYIALARYDLGYTRLAQHNYKDALVNFNYVIDSKPDKQMLADAYNRAADCLYYQSQFAEAGNYYKKAFETNPSEGDYPMFQQAVMKGYARDHKGKIAAIDQMIAQFSASALVPAAILEKGDSYSALGDNASALSSYRTLTKNYPETSYGRQGALRMAITHQSIGNENDAIAAYREIITNYPSSEEAKLASDDLRSIYAARGELKTYQQFMNSVPGAPAIDLSEIEALAFRTAEADYTNTGSPRQLQAYIDEYPNGTYMPQALWLMADYYEGRDDAKKALEYATAVVERYPHSDVTPDALLIKGRQELAEGRAERALATYKTLEASASGTRMTQQARLGIARAAVELNRNQEALDATEKILQSSPVTDISEQKEVAFIHAQALYNLDRKNEAMTEWKLISSDSENLFGSKAAVALAEAYLAAGNARQAQKVADDLINANPPHQYWLARGFIALSDALRAQGETFEADEYLKSLKSNYPGTEADIFDMIDKRLK